MILQYVGISFITGAVSHGFFSGTRAALLAIIGIICFLIGILISSNEEKAMGKILLVSMCLALSIGMFTGGLQHFLDSPDRSLFITPIGFLGSIIFFSLLHSYRFSRSSYWYMAISAISVLLFSIGYFLLISYFGMQGMPDHHSSILPTEAGMSSMCHQMPNGQWMGDCPNNPLTSSVPNAVHDAH